MTDTSSYHITGAYEIRSTLSALGGRWDASSREWVLTAEQYARLCEKVDESDARSNRRDRHLATVFLGDACLVRRVEP